MTLQPTYPHVAYFQETSSGTVVSDPFPRSDTHGAQLCVIAEKLQWCGFKAWVDACHIASESQDAVRYSPGSS